MVMASIGSYLSGIPTDLQSGVSDTWQNYQSVCSTSGIDPITDHQVLPVLAKAWACSQFISTWCANRPLELADLVKDGDLFNASLRQTFLPTLKKRALGCSSEQDLISQLRHFRNRQLVRIAIRDIGGLADLEETLKDLTGVAEASLQIAHDTLYEQAREKGETPLLSDGQPQRLVILGMGKLGAFELNFSSDIDLVFSFPEDGKLSDKRDTSYGEFFTRLGRKLINVIDTVTQDGFVFRVDMRLRPFGESGPLVMSFEAMENYYQDQAREWERYAMIKVRPVAGDMEAGERLRAMLQPFVYRRYLDYGAFSELRELKAKITQELKRKERLQNIKLGPGGIREIEFIGQAFQLIRGGRDRALQQQEILKVLTVLGEQNQLPIPVVGKLKDAYRFLRIVENRLQQFADRQAHDLPNDEEHRLRLAFSMGFENWELFENKLKATRTFVHEVFEQVFAAPQSDDQNDKAKVIWNAPDHSEDVKIALLTLGYLDSEKSWNLIQTFRDTHAIGRLSAKGAKTLDKLMPMVLAGVASLENPEQSLKRLLDLIETIANREVYISLLVENPLALSQLFKLASASPWIVSYIARVPMLLDELLDPRRLYAPLSKPDLKKELDRRMAMIPKDDLEQQMTELRHFKQAAVLRVAAADIADAIPLMVVSDYLTDIAEVILDRVVAQTWQTLTEKQGIAHDKDEDQITGFCIIGYGKLGGLELGYGSDLDLVFLFDPDDADLLSRATKPITANQFFVRLGQRIINMLSANLFSGVLYEVDMRLRPSGNSGLLVSSINAFATYQENDAWTWEHQALVRARFVAGDVNLAQRFQEYRASTLCKQRNGEQLKREVNQMRDKMRDNLAVKNPDLFDLKQGVGGIADIEFLVQYGVLRFAHEHNNLVKYPDNVRLLEGLQTAGVLSEQESTVLKSAYCEYRNLTHRLALQNKKALVPNQTLKDYRGKVQEVWKRLLTE